MNTEYRLARFAASLGIVGGGAKVAVALELLARCRNRETEGETGSLIDLLLTSPEAFCDDCLSPRPCYCQNDE